MSIESLRPVDIDTGRFKYVLIKVKSGDQVKYLVRGYTFAGYHADVYEKCEDAELKPLKKQLPSLKWDCVGGGRILHDQSKKTITIFGYSQGFGQADHSISCDLVKQAYPDYSSIEWNNAGY